MPGCKDCVDFVQEVYHSTGLSLYFTKVFTKNELLELNTPAARKAFIKYGSRDTLEDKLMKVESISKMALAEELNLSVEQKIDISCQEKTINSHCGREQSVTSFAVVLNENDLKIFDVVERQSSILPGIGNNAYEVTKILNNLALTDEQINQSRREAKEIFEGMKTEVNNSKACSFITPHEVLFTRQTEENQAWIKEITDQVEELHKEVEQDNDYNAQTFYSQARFICDDYNEFPFDANNSISVQINMIGQVLETESENCLIC